MTQKQIIGLAVGALVLAVVFAFVYRQFAAPAPDALNQPPKTILQPAKKAEEPKTIDDISQAIQDETNLDLSALDDEADGEISDIEADSDSVNNLGTSYDENSL